jgi:hypothetical protein
MKTIVYRGTNPLKNKHIHLEKSITSTTKSRNSTHRVSRYQTIVYRGTKLSCIEVPTIVYRGTDPLDNKYIYLEKSIIAAIKKRNIAYRISSDQLSCIKVPDYRVSRYQTIVYQGTRPLKNKHIPLPENTVKTIKTRNRTYRVSRYQTIVYRGTKLSCIEVPTIVYRGTDYRVSRYLAPSATAHLAGDSATYPQAANHSLIFLNPRAWTRERARIHARERQPFARKLASPQPNGWPCSATPALSGAAEAATTFASLRNLIRFEKSLRLPSSRLRSFRPAFGGLTRPNGLRLKGAAMPQPCSLRESAFLSNAAIAASIWIQNRYLLIGARLAVFAAFSFVTRETQNIRGFDTGSTAFGLSGLRPAPMCISRLTPSGAEFFVSGGKA